MYKQDQRYKSQQGPSVGWLTTVASGFSWSSWWRTQHSLRKQPFNTLKPRPNGRHFPDDIFRCIFLNQNVWNLIKVSLIFVPKGPINDIPTLLQRMAWRRPGAKPLSEPIMVSLLMQICFTQPQWVNHAIMGQNWLESAHFWLIMAGFQDASWLLLLLKSSQEHGNFVNLGLTSLLSGHRISNV